MGFNGADKSEALIHLKGSAGGGFLRDFSIGTAAGGYRGGSLIRLEAKASSAPDATAIENLYMTSYSGASAFAPTAGTNANPGVFTKTAHGLTVGKFVVVLVTTRGSGWRDLNFQVWKVRGVPTADTFTLETVAGAALDTTSWGSFPTGGITVKEALCADVLLSIDGTARTTGAVGVRNTKLNHLQIFGGASAAIEALGAVELSAPGVTTSHAGWNGQVYLGGVSGVETYYAQFDGGTIAALNEDYSIYAHGSSVIQSWHKRTANTFYSDVKGARGGDLIDTSTLVNLNTSKDCIHHGGSVYTIFVDVTGLSGAPASKNYGVTFNSAPRVRPFRGSQTTLGTPGVSSIDVTNGTSSTDTLEITGQF
jgi:hypothetical protein